MRKKYWLAILPSQERLQLLMLELRRSLIIKEEGEKIARSMVQLQQMLIIINLKHKMNGDFAATSMIWTTVRNT